MQNGWKKRKRDTRLAKRLILIVDTDEKSESWLIEQSYLVMVNANFLHQIFVQNNLIQIYTALSLDNNSEILRNMDATEEKFLEINEKEQEVLKNFGIPKVF